MALAADFDTFNRCVVGVRTIPGGGSEFVIQYPRPMRLTRAQAQSLAAWLAVLAFESVDDAKEALDRVAAT